MNETLRVFYNHKISNARKIWFVTRQVFNALKSDDLVKLNIYWLSVTDGFDDLIKVAKSGIIHSAVYDQYGFVYEQNKLGDY